MPTPEITHYGCNMFMFGFKNEDVESGHIIWSRRKLVMTFPLVIPVMNPDVGPPSTEEVNLISGGGTLNTDSIVPTYLSSLVYDSDLWRRSTIFTTFSLSGLNPAAIVLKKHTYDQLIISMNEMFSGVIDLMNIMLEGGFPRFAIWDGVVGHSAFSATTTDPNTSQHWVDTETGEVTDGGNYEFPFYCPNFNGAHSNRGFLYMTINEETGVKTIKSLNNTASYETAPWKLVLKVPTNAFAGRAVSSMSFFDGLLPNFDPNLEDPYLNMGSPSSESEIDPTFNRLGDDVEFATEPALDAIDTGFVTLYAPATIQNLRDLATYMWDNSLFDLDNWKKIFADPMEAILGLSLVPFPVPVSGSDRVTIGNLTTDIYMAKVSKQWVTIDCGSIAVRKYWGSYLDYDPYTQIEIYLPYIGTKPLRADDIMNSTVSVKYIVDIISGACVAEIKSTVVNSNSAVLYRFSGMCTAQIPISGNSYDNIFSGLTKLLGGAATGIVSMGLGNPMGVIGGVGAAASGVVDINKPHIDRSGGINSTAGFLTTQKPVLIFTFPRLCSPSNQQHYTGYPSFITEDLSKVSGYTEIEKIHIEGFTGTETELAELETLLKGGVMF